MVGHIAAMEIHQSVVSVVCQWCERVIREGDAGRELVTCLSCAQSFGANFHHAGVPVLQARDAASAMKGLVGAR